MTVTVRAILLCVASLVLGVLFMKLCASLIGAAHAGVGPPFADDSTPEWHRAMVAWLPWLVLGLFGITQALLWLSCRKPAWPRLARLCAWLRVGRRQANLASLAAAVFVVVPAAAEWTVQPRDVANAVGMWLLARNLPGGMEPKPERSPT